MAASSNSGFRLNAIALRDANTGEVLWRCSLDDEKERCVVL
jgi:hypothetical protein